MGLKPIKIKLNNNTASGMYILLEEHEITYAKNGETKPPNRAYKIEVAVETMYMNKRARGKNTFNIQKGTSISKAVGMLLGKRETMKSTLRAKGTLKVEKQIIQKINSKDRIFKSVYDAWINGKKISKRADTVKGYEGCYNGTLKHSKIINKVIDDITEDDIQNIINDMINKGKKPLTINIVKVVLKPLLELNDVHLNWKKITLPTIKEKEKFSGTDEDAKLIAKTLLEYQHPIARGVFAFLLSGRRINETMLMEHSHINYEATKDYPFGYFILPKENTKTNTEVIYGLTPLLIDAIKTQKTTKGIIFNLNKATINYHWKLAMTSIGVTNMVMHDLRSMVAVVSLRNGSNIYAVSKMLSHKKLSTTQANYLNNDTSQAVEAQNMFTAVIGYSDEIIDTEVIVDEYEALKNIYPNASNKQIKSVMEMMK